MRAAAFGLAVVVACFGGCQGGGTPDPFARTGPAKAGDLCMEDDECWDCHADGNGICGTDVGGEQLQGGINE